METALLIGLIAATLRIATPLILGGLGETLIEKSGILNLGIEGIMLLGAFSAFLATYFMGDPWFGVLAAILVGAILGLLMGGLTVSLGLQQHVCGLGVTILASGLALFTFRLFFGEPQIPPQIKTLGYKQIAATLPLIGTITKQSPLTYLTFLLAPLMHIVVFQTPFGLRLRAVGELPEAAENAGISVHKTRYEALLIGGALVALGGAFLSVAQLGAFTYGIVAGRGWICIALVVFGNWKPMKILLGALLYAGVEALQLRLQTLGFGIPYQVFLALPYIITIAALVVAQTKAAYPGAFLQPFRKGGTTG